MKHYILMIFLLFTVKGFTQVLEGEISLSNTREEIYDNLQVTKKANFLGGEKELFRFYKENSKIEVSNIKKPDQSIYFNLLIDEKGKVYDYKITMSFEKKHNKELNRLIRKMPDWEPAEHNGKKVKVSVLEYITFN